MSTWRQLLLSLLPAQRQAPSGSSPSAYQQAARCGGEGEGLEGSDVVLSLIYSASAPAWARTDLACAPKAGFSSRETDNKLVNK